MAQSKGADFNTLLAERILYQLCATGYVVMRGESLTDTSENIEKARGLIKAMLDNRPKGKA